MYSAPSEFGVLYRTHSPAEATGKSIVELIPSVSGNTFEGIAMTLPVRNELYKEVEHMSVRATKHQLPRAVDLMKRLIAALKARGSKESDGPRWRQGKVLTVYEQIFSPYIYEMGHVEKLPIAGSTGVDDRQLLGDAPNTPTVFENQISERAACRSVKFCVQLRPKQSQKRCNIVATRFSLHRENIGLQTLCVAQAASAWIELCYAHATPLRRARSCAYSSI